MKKSILVVDDAPFIREIVKQTLMDHESFTLLGEASDGAMAIEQALTLSPDIILMDIVMPKVSGIIATEEILKRRPETKIISFTTLDQTLILEQVKAAGCVAHLKKPFTREEILICLKSLFSQS